MIDLINIRTKVESVKNTQKITKAMGMVAASKMRKTQQRMETSRPYARTISQVIQHVSQGNLEYKHSYLQAREVKRAGYLLISTNKGLCSGLNINLFKSLLDDLKSKSTAGIATQLAIIGQKGVSFFGNIGIEIAAQVTGLTDTPTLSDLIGPAQVMLTAYNTHNIDQLFLVYNRFTNGLIQTPVVELLLPLVPSTAERHTTSKTNISFDYLYEPDPVSLLNELLARFVEVQVYQAVVENLACEQAARMLAMQTATDNTIHLIDELQLEYNRARQSGITQELNEIVSGASAV